jgi:iron complex outermembrane receptor protein
MYGQSPPGGLINFVSKKPALNQPNEVQLQTGDPLRGQVAFDLNGAADGYQEDANLYYRVVGKARAAETQVDEVDDDRLMLAPSLTWVPGENSSLTLQAHYIKDSGASLQFLPSQGTRFDNPNGDIPRDTFLGEPGFDDFEREQWALGYLFDTVIAGWQFHQGLRVANVDYDLDVIRGAGFANTDDSTQPNFLREVNRRAAQIYDESRAVTVDNNIARRFVSGAFTHRILVGLDYLRQDTDYSFAGAMVDSLDIFDPQYGATPGAFNTFTDDDQQLDQTGLYLQDQIHYQRFRLTLSGRQDWFDIDTRDRLTDTSETTDGDQFTWRAALLYAFDSGLSPYYSYATSFQPELGTDANGESFEPTEGHQQELGLKYLTPGGNTLLTLALFDLTQENLVVNDPATLQARQIGEVEVQGVEVSAKSDLGNGLDVIASYAYQDSEITEAAPATEGNRVPYVPDHQASLWLDYAFQNAELRGISLASGLRYVDSVYGDEANSVETGDYTLVDLAARVNLARFTETLRGARFAVNVANLFDKEYVTSCNNAATCYYGNARTVRGTLSYRW